MTYEYVSNVKFEDYIDKKVYVKFLAKDVKMQISRNGEKYINLTMKHKSTEINLKYFDVPIHHLDYIHNGKVYSCTVNVQPYAKSPTGYGCTVYNIDILLDENPKDYIEYAEGMDKAYEVVKRTLSKLEGTIYKDIVYNILTEDWNNFYIWTAAKSQHHNILGGLIVHTSEVIEQCELLADYWNLRNGETFINKELLISAALIHDVCKLQELDVDTISGSTEYSKHGALSTHILDVCTKVEVQAAILGLGKQKLDSNGQETKTIEQLEREKEQVLLLKHCLAAHHGKLEYGSCITPHIPEAEILHMMDELSAVMYKYNKKFKELNSGDFTSSWLPNGLDVTYKESSKI